MIFPQKQSPFLTGITLQFISNDNWFSRLFFIFYQEVSPFILRLCSIPPYPFPSCLPNAHSIHFSLCLLAPCVASCGWGVEWACLGAEVGGRIGKKWLSRCLINDPSVACPATLGLHVSTSVRAGRGALFWEEMVSAAHSLSLIKRKRFTVINGQIKAHNGGIDFYFFF